MDKLKAIIKREYLIRVRSKGFLFGTIASPVLLVLYMTVPILMVKLASHKAHQIAIVDQFGDDKLYQMIERNVTRNNQSEKVAERMGETNRYYLRREVARTPEAAQALQAALTQQLESGQLTAFVVLPPNALATREFGYFAQNVGDITSKNHVSDAINEAVIQRRMDDAGLDLSRVNDLSREVELNTINRRGEREKGQTFFLTFGLIMAIYVSILIYGIMVMRGVIEEKQWRIIEVLLSSVKPSELMLGKLIGIGMVGLTQFAVWSLTGILMTSVTALPMAKMANVSIPTIQPSLMFFFVLFFTLGYFLYATLYAMVGAIVSNEEDGQQMQIPVTMTIVIPVMISGLVMQDPNSTVSTVLSLVPFFSPILMFMRISFQTPPVWQILLSIGLLIGTILALIMLAAKVYRVGVLMYGKRPTLPEVVRWLRYS
jgi:ABC-2 type transport system permease protein